MAEHEEEQTKKSERNFILYEDFEGELKTETFVNEAHETMLERLKIYDVSEDEFRIWKNWLGGCKQALLSNTSTNILEDPLKTILSGLKTYTRWKALITHNSPEITKRNACREIGAAELNILSRRKYLTPQQKTQSVYGKIIIRVTRLNRF